MDKALSLQDQRRSPVHSTSSISFPFRTFSPEHTSLTEQTFQPRDSVHHTDTANYANTVEYAHTLEATQRLEHEWLERFPRLFRSDIVFLLNHPSGKNLKTHYCMGVAHTHAFKSADHTRVAPHTLLAAEIATDMARHLQLSPREARDLVAAVAGHDQGHIFASHQSESAINSFPEFDGSPGRPAFCHERRTKQLFESDEFTRHFGIERSERIKAILYDRRHPHYMLVDWADRLAYLLVDSINIGHKDIIDSCHIRRTFIQSLQNLPDGTIGFSNLDPALSLVNARDLLYDRVSIGRASALFSGFLTEAFHRVIAKTCQPITRFVNELADRSTPEARQLFLQEDMPRLYCPNQHPALAKPVDLDYRAICHVTLDMLSEKGRDWAIDSPPLSPNATAAACLRPRANMGRFEHLVRSTFSQAALPGFLELCGGVIGISHMPPKRYHLRTLDPSNAVRDVPVDGKEKWEFFIGIPQSHGASRGLHQIACDALIQEGLIRPTCIEKLRQLPAHDFFTRSA